MSQGSTDSESGSTMAVLQEVLLPGLPPGGHVTTVLVKHPPGAPGHPPHRLPGGPGLGYMVDGEMLFEIEGETPRVLRAGDAFYGDGGDVIHYRDANNRSDIPCSFVLTLFRVPGQPLIEWVTDAELEERKSLRVSTSRRTEGHGGAGAAATTTAAATAGRDSGYERVHEWRAATRGLVLLRATATTMSDRPRSRGSISITLAGRALSNDLLLADTGTIALTSLGDHTDARIHPMRVLPMQLEALSDLPVVCVSGQGITEPTRLRLVVDLTARNPRTDETSVITRTYDPVVLNAKTSLVHLDFEAPTH
jgi:quercetin dioxygenase-like cupin family protein